MIKKIIRYKFKTKENEEKEWIKYVDENGNEIQAISPHKLYAPISRLIYKDEIPEFVMQKAIANGNLFEERIIRYLTSNGNFTYALHGLWKRDEKQNKMVLTPIGDKIKKAIGVIKNKGIKGLIRTQNTIAREYNGHLFACIIDLEFKFITIELKQSSQKKTNNLVKILQDGQLWMQSYCSNKKAYMLWSGDLRCEWYKFENKNEKKKRDYDIKELVDFLLYLYDNREILTIAEQDLLMKEWLEERNISYE